MATLHLPQSMRPGLVEHPLTLGQSDTLGRALEQLAVERPELAERFWHGGKLLPGFFVFKNQQHVLPAQIEGTPLAEKDQVRLVQPLSGG